MIETADDLSHEIEMVEYDEIDSEIRECMNVYNTLEREVVVRMTDSSLSTIEVGVCRLSLKHRVKRTYISRKKLLEAIKQSYSSAYNELCPFKVELFSSLVAVMLRGHPD